VPQSADLLLRAIFSGRYTWCVLLAPALVAFGVFFNAKLQSLNRGWLEWSPFHVKTNVALLPIRVRLVWLPYSLLLAFVMPCLALAEELLFRSGTTDWVRGLLWGSVAFGLFHLFSLVTIRMAIYLMVIGAMFVELYMRYGIVAVFVVHSIYNLVSLALIVATRRRGLPGVSAARPVAGRP
jgi:Type II CAAX prenyl endopeptidase Rce1-like